MKLISETKALKSLQAIKTEFAQRITTVFEYRAKSCLTCETKGACCLDAHFVNVRITRLEAVAIRKRLDELSEGKQRDVCERIDTTIDEYDLTGDGDAFEQTYACPLFEKETGCLVHEYGKPLPCINHACYGRKEDLPPDELLTTREIEIDKLNERVYGNPANWLPIPIAVKKHAI